MCNVFLYFAAVTGRPQAKGVPILLLDVEHHKDYHTPPSLTRHGEINRTGSSPARNANHTQEHLSMAAATTEKSSELSEELEPNIERLKRDLYELSQIGMNQADHGLYRMGFTDEDMQSRQWLREKAADAGLESRMDEAGNVLVWSPDHESDGQPAVLTGSHLDSVRAGGTLDGALGVLVSFECLRTIHEKKMFGQYPVEVVAFADEEGRFGGMFGSEAFCGEITPGTIHERKDMNGVKLEVEMKRHGMDPMRALEARRDPATLKAYLELHIEQGPVLDRLKKPVGIVEAISGLERWTITLRGTPNHAGTTPMDMRDDAFMGLADFAHEIPRVLDENGSELSRATIGKANIVPGSPNTVPGSVEFSLDFRDTSADVLGELHQAFRKALSAIARRRNLMFEFDRVSRIEPVVCEDFIVRSLLNQCRKLEMDYQTMPSGAAHDAQMMANITQVGMVFVPSKDGQSHSPAEWTAWSDIEAGTRLMLHSLVDLSQGDAG
jgi:N-carbamoyl-L-amino-acid hydrolase